MENMETGQSTARQGYNPEVYTEALMEPVNKVRDDSIDLRSCLELCRAF
jgi:hypothetical protein